MARVPTICPDKLTRIFEIAGNLAVATFDTTANIVRLTAGSFVTVSGQTAVPCAFERAQIAPQENTTEMGRLFVDDRWIFSFPLDTVVRFQDRIISNGRTWEVIHVNKGSGAILLEVFAHELVNLN